MRGAGRRLRPKDSFAKQAPPPPPLDHRQFGASRDSDASFASSRPSSIGIGRSAAAEIANDRSYQQTAVRTVNGYLAAHSSVPLSLKTPYPSAKDITETLKFLMARLDYPSSKLDEDLPIIMKTLNCPFKLNKSTLRAPGTPHTWPTFLAVIHWLVQIAMHKDHTSANSTPFWENDSLYCYALDSYLNYIRGDDDSVDALDGEFSLKLEQEMQNVTENLNALKENSAELELKLEGLKSGPSQREVLEREISINEEDVEKFHVIIRDFTERIARTEKVLGEKEKELDAKVEEKKKKCEENEELKKRVELQTFNWRDVERMKRELQAVERDIGDAEVARNTWEEKSWNLDTNLGHQFKELEALAMECNQAMRRLKLANGFQYALNAKGSTATEVMGIDYKGTLKPALDSIADDIKRSSMEKLEELVPLQHQLSENAAKIEVKRNRIATLQSQIDEMEAQLNLLKKETEDYCSRCVTEAIKMAEEVQMDSRNLDIVEREAAEVLTATKLKLQEAIKQCEEEIQMRARELFALVDSVSKYKEYTESRISEMRSDLSETALAVSNAYKGSLPAQFSNIFDPNLT